MKMAGCICLCHNAAGIIMDRFFLRMRYFQIRMVGFMGSVSFFWWWGKMGQGGLFLSCGGSYMCGVRCFYVVQNLRILSLSGDGYDVVEGPLSRCYLNFFNRFFIFFV